MMLVPQKLCLGLHGAALGSTFKEQSQHSWYSFFLGFLPQICIPSLSLQRTLHHHYLNVMDKYYQIIFLIA
jgi:hypothetical protein